MQVATPLGKALAGLTLVAASGCIESYMPDVVNAPAQYLVVDGFINGNGRTRIHLSRSASISTTTLPPAERGASVLIVDEQGGKYPLTEKSAGYYQSDSLLLPTGRRYQLRLTTAGSQAATYESDLVPLKVTPPLDKVAWQVQNDLVQLSLSTHDPTGQSRFYRWGFTETWEFNSAFQSTVEYDYTLAMIVPRTTPIYTCWHTDRSSLIKQGSSAQLSQDALTDVSLLDIPDRDERLKIRYSLLVTQVAETAEEFAYYELLRKNTEAVGTVNDPLPSQLTGNVHRTGTATTEPVFGYVGAHTLQQQRIFINRQDLPFPNTWQFDDPYRNCTYRDTLPESVFNNMGNVPIAYSKGRSFSGSTRECVDCRLRGSNVKPSFW